MNEIFVARAIILNEKNEVLLGERARGTAAGFMELPGGKVDRGEEPKVASVREIKEETSLDFTVIGLFDDRPDVSEKDIYRTFYYYGRATGKIRLNHELRSAGFFAEEEIPSKMAFRQEIVLADFFKWQREVTRKSPF
jgi:8-oxo-dGTP pyrophosphatase MutT (NUDIX family)